jgi:hypothetical protein
VKARFATRVRLIFLAAVAAVAATVAAAVSWSPSPWLAAAALAAIGAA